MRQSCKATRVTSIGTRKAADNGEVFVSGASCDITHRRSVTNRNLSYRPASRYILDDDVNILSCMYITSLRRSRVYLRFKDSAANRVIIIINIKGEVK